MVAGTGIAMGFTAGRSRARPGRERATPDSAPSYSKTSFSETAPDESNEVEEFLNIEPLLDRLERVEARIESISRPEERAAAAIPADSGNYFSLLADLDRRVEENTRELELLRERVTEAERSVNASVAAVQLKVEETRAELPDLVERNVSARFDDLRSRFAAETEQSHQRVLASFEEAIGEKISLRIGAIEKALADQAGSIESLRVRATETDNNLQRLVIAIEKLCERAQLIAPAAEPQVARTPIPRSNPYDIARQAFETQFDDAMRRDPVKPVIVQEDRPKEPGPGSVKVLAPDGEVPAPAFAAKAPKKSRFLFRNLIVAGFGLLASRFLR